MKDRPGTVTRSVTLGRDVDAAVQHVAGTGGCSAFLTEAAILALQARGVAMWVQGFQARHGGLSTADRDRARKRLADAAHELKP